MAGASTASASASAILPRSCCVYIGLQRGIEGYISVYRDTKGHLGIYRDI